MVAEQIELIVFTTPYGEVSLIEDVRNEFRRRRSRTTPINTFEMPMFTVSICELCSLMECYSFSGD